MEGYDQILYLSDLIATNGEVLANIVPQWPDSTKWRVRIKYCTSVTWEHQMERYDQILYLSDLIVPNGEVWSNIVLSDLVLSNGEVWSNIVPQCDLIVPNGEVWSNIVPQWPVTWSNIVPQWMYQMESMIKYCTSVTGIIKWRGMIKYCTSDLIVPNGEVWSNIIQWPDSNKWRGIGKYCTSVTW